MKEILKKQLVKDGWQTGKKLLLAVSGGVDSMLLWHFVHDLKIDYAIAHVNFQLRGNESEADQKMVENIAKVRKTKVFLLKEETKSFAEKKGISIQMAAREIRYTWFEKLMLENKFDFLCTAHHLNDSIETFFINLDRGTGIKGLGGISSTQKILRPLIAITKDEIRDYASQHDLVYREDKSNQINKYKRNWLRNTILADWKIKNPAFEKTMAKNISRFNKAEQVYQKAINSDLLAIRSELVSGCFSVEYVMKLKFPEESLFELLSEYGFTETQIQNLYYGIKNKHVGLLLETGILELNLDREKIYLRKKERTIEGEEYFLYKYQNSLEVPFQMSFEIISNNEISFNENKKSEYLDFDKLSFPLKFRKWRNGDRMKPIGMKGKKKISDLLIDLKVPLLEKDNCWVIESNGKIAWLIGFKVSEEFKVDNNTNQVLKIHVK